MDLEGKLHDKLVDTILKVSLAKSYEGRDTLLLDIPEHLRSDLQRDRNSDWMDISLLVRQLKEIFWEHSNCLEWALLSFINRGRSRVENTTLSKQLKDLCLECIHSLPREQAIRMQHIFGSEYRLDKSISQNLIPVNTVQTLPIPPMIPISHPQIVVEEAFLAQEQTDFFGRAERYVTLSQHAFIEVSTLIEEQSLEYFTPPQIRKVASSLEKISQQLQLLSQLLDNTIPLPQEVIPHHQRFIEAINYILEQLQETVEQIDKDIITDELMQEKWPTIKAELTAFNILIMSKKVDGRNNV